MMKLCCRAVEMPLRRIIVRSRGSIIVLNEMAAWLVISNPLLQNIFRTSVLTKNLPVQEILGLKPQFLYGYNSKSVPYYDVIVKNNTVPASTWAPSIVEVIISIINAVRSITLAFPRLVETILNDCSYSVSQTRHSIIICDTPLLTAVNYKAVLGFD